MGLGPSHDHSNVATFNSNGNTHTVDIILVRHGISCANLRKKAMGLLSHTFVSDPELTQEGTHQAQIRGYFLRKKIEEDYPMMQPIVGASVLLRAQMTAYLMMYPPVVHMIPYVSETGFGRDNKPDFITQGKKIKRNSLYRNMNVKEMEPWPEDATTPNWDKFRNFIKSNYNQLTQYTGDKVNRSSETNQSMKMAKPLIQYYNKIQQGLKSEIKYSPTEYEIIRLKDPTNASKKYFSNMIPQTGGNHSNRPLVIVSHGHFIESVLKKYGVTITQEQRPNYAAFKFVFDLTSGNIIGKPEPYMYMPTYDKNGVKIDILSPEIDVKKECKLQEETHACSVDPCTSRGSEEIYIKENVTSLPKNSWITLNEAKAKANANAKERENAKERAKTKEIENAKAKANAEAKAEANARAKAEANARAKVEAKEHANAHANIAARAKAIVNLERDSHGVVRPVTPPSTRLYSGSHNNTNTTVFLGGASKRHRKTRRARQKKS